MNVTLKNVPEPVYKVIKQEAKRNRRSLNAEIICVLERTAAEVQRWKKADSLMEKVERFRASMPPLPDSTRFIRQERDRH